MVLAFRFFRAIPAPQTAMLAAVACWRVVAEAAASEAYSASCYDLIEDIGILPVVESECKLIEVQGQILFRHLVVIADDAPFQERPERFNRLRVNATAHILFARVRHAVMRVSLLIEMAIMMRFVRGDQRDVTRDDLPNEFFVRIEARILDHLADYVTLPSDGADDLDFVAQERSTAPPAASAAPASSWRWR